MRIKTFPYRAIRRTKINILMLILMVAASLGNTTIKPLYIFILLLLIVTFEIRYIVRYHKYHNLLIILSDVFIFFLVSVISLIIYFNASVY